MFLFNVNLCLFWSFFRDVLKLCRIDNLLQADFDKSNKIIIRSLQKKKIMNVKMFATLKL